MRDWKGKRASKVDPRVETALLLAAAVLLLGPNYCCQLIRTLQAGVNLPHAVMLSTTFFENCLPAPGHHPSSELFLPFFFLGSVAPSSAGDATPLLVLLLTYPGVAFPLPHSHPPDALARPAQKQSRIC